MATANPSAERTRITPSFVGEYFAGYCKGTPFLPRPILEAYRANVACSTAAAPHLFRAYSHEDAATMLEDIAKLDGDLCNVAMDIDIVAPLVDYIVLWLKFRTPRSRRLRHRHLGYLLALLIRFVNINEQVGRLYSAAGRAENRLETHTMQCVNRAFENRESDWSRMAGTDNSAVMRHQFLLKAVAMKGYLFNAAKASLGPLVAAMRPRCAHVAKHVRRAIAADRERHVPPHAYRGVVDRVAVPPHDAAKRTCAICLDALADPAGKAPRTAHRLACGHAFHPICLHRYLVSKGNSTRCPCCRHDTMAA